jgi:hypothetical protein
MIAMPQNMAACDNNGNAAIREPKNRVNKWYHGTVIMRDI